MISRKDFRCPPNGAGDNGGHHSEEEKMISIKIPPLSPRQELGAPYGSGAPSRRAQPCRKSQCVVECPRDSLAPDGERWGTPWGTWGTP